MVKKAEAVEKIDVKRAPITLNITCGSCMFLHKAGAYKNSKGDVNCEYFGTIASSTPCRLYTPEPRKLDKDRNVGELLEILMEVDNPHALAAALLARPRVKRLGYHLGQKVFFHVMGGDYVCNYASGNIFGAVHDLLIIEGSGCTAMYKSTSLLTSDQWMMKLGKLLSADKINDPDGGIRHVGKDVNLSLRYQPPLLRTKIGPVKQRGRKKRTETISLS